MASSHDREHRVRVRAYHLWETEGRPEGREAEFWHRAAEIDHHESTAGQDSGATPQAASRPEPDPAPAAPAKKPRAKASPAASASKPKQPAEMVAAPKAAPRKRASAPMHAPVSESAPKPNSARAGARPAEHP